MCREHLLEPPSPDQPALLRVGPCLNLRLQLQRQLSSATSMTGEVTIENLDKVLTFMSLEDPEI